MIHTNVSVGLDNFESLIKHFLKEQEQELKSALMNEQKEKSNQTTIPSYKVDTGVLKNWNDFLEREKKKEDSKSNIVKELAKLNSVSSVKDKEACSTDELFLFSINESDEIKDLRYVRAYVAEGYTITQAEKLVKLDNFLIANKEFFKQSEIALKSLVALRNLDVNKIIMKEKFLMFKKFHGNLSQEEMKELKEIESLKNQDLKEKMQIKSFLTQKEVEKIRANEERIELRKQFYKSKGYKEEHIDELIKKEFY